MTAVLSPPVPAQTQPSPSSGILHRSVYDIPAPPISDVELFLRTFVRLFAYSDPPQKHLPKTSRLDSSPQHFKSNLSATHPSERLGVVLEEPSPSSPSTPISSSPGSGSIFTPDIVAGRVQDLFLRALNPLSHSTDSITADHRNGPVPDVPLPPLPQNWAGSTSKRLSPEIASTFDYDKTMKEIAELELLVSTRAPASRYVPERFVPELTIASEEPSIEDVENWNGDIEDFSDRSDWFFIPAPNPTILQQRLLSSKTRRPTLPKVKFRVVDFQSTSNPSIMSLPTPMATLAAKVGPISPTSLQPNEELAKDEFEPIYDMEALISDPFFAVEKLITSARKRQRASNVSRSSAGYMMPSRRAPGQQSFSSVTSGTSATSTSESGVSVHSGSSGVEPYSGGQFGKNSSLSSAKLKPKQRHLRFSSKQRAQSDNTQESKNAGTVTSGVPRSNSESTTQYTSTSAKPSRAQAPYGDNPNSSYYVLTSMGVKLVTPGKEGSSDILGDLNGSPRKESSSSGGSGSSSWFFGRKNRGSQGSRASRASQGSRGSQGSQGSQGSRGSRGSQGTQGSQMSK
ncbi:hypothetical protein V1509DRAFT_633969 [Lipomyces kononenkoae]